MAHVSPIRMSMWRAGGMLLTLSLIASVVAVSTEHLTAPGIALAAPANGRSWGSLAIEYTLIVVCGWWSANGVWSNWHRRGLAQPVAVAEPPTTRVRWTWTMNQLILGALFLVADIWLALVTTATVDEESRLILVIAVALGTIGVSYLHLAWRVGKLERAHGVVYYWQRQPGILSSFENVRVDAVPTSAVLW